VGAVRRHQPREFVLADICPRDSHAVELEVDEHIHAFEQRDAVVK
jgi:hypothetical protein